jgi:lipopolysaccharide transport system permease protein
MPGGRRVFVREFRARFRQTQLRFVWLFVPAATTTLTWTYLGHAGVTSFAATTGMPYAAYVGIGTVLWQVFVDALGAPLHWLGQSRDILKTSRLPHESWLVASVLDVLTSFVVRLAVLAVLLVALGVHPTASVVAAPLSIAVLLLFGFSIGLLITPLGLIYQDIEQGIALVAGFGFFLTPVVYPAPTHNVGAVLVRLNPLTQPIDVGRAAFVGQPVHISVGLVIVGLVALGLTAAALVIYRVSQPHVVGRL